MAMRITTKMIQNTSIRNLNMNKERQEKLTNQMATGKKITRPSDDPVTAIRALKLNASLDKIDQYYERNSEDAKSWLELTDKAIDTVANLLGGDTGMKALLIQANADYLENGDLLDIVKQLVNLAEEYYSVGNADSAGRTLFTGYRTDLPLAFKEPKSETYKITEQRTKLNMDKMTYVASGCLKELNEGNFNSTDGSGNLLMNTTEYEVSTNEIYRFRLAYDNTDAVESVEKDANGDPAPILDGNGDPVKAKDINGNPVQDEDGNPVNVYMYEPEVTFEFGNFKTGEVTKYSVNPYDRNGNFVANEIQCFASATEEAYMTVVNDPDAVVYIASTGELLLGDNVKQSIAELDSDVEVRLSYEKTEWKKNDLDPVHYFYTERKHPTQDRQLIYNDHFLEDPTANGKQIIEYDIGNNQTIRVNTTADEIYTHNVGRDIYEFQAMVEEQGVILDNLNKIKSMIESGEYIEEDLETLERQKAALEKAKTYIDEKVKSRAGELLTNFNGYIEQVNVASTNCGSRGARLTLIQNRLGTQQENYEELVSRNEDANYADLATQLASIKTSYDAALASISYVMQTSLLDYIR
ncbi:MAG: hypothetical protein HDR25_08240 [Lachnospiraceae bacterium]|nr:hypothetical protein [Lachnospiraceae bacterium]